MIPIRSPRLSRYRNILFAVAIMSLLIPGLYVIKTWVAGETWEALEQNHFWYSILFTFTVSAAIFAANITAVRKLDTWLPWNQYVAKRIALEIILTSFNAALIMLLWTYLYDQLFARSTDFYKSMLFNNLFIALIANAIATAVMEGSAFFRAWKASLIEAESLQKENLRTQYEALKSQVNPHFLFNSLNTLSSLVHSRPDTAEEFINEFARFYRYILEIKDKNLVSLRDEFSMAESYMYLQQIRFGKALQVHQNVFSEHWELYLPPLSLQILLENAIKHNAFSRESPLSIFIEVQNNYLIVRNTFQKRQEEVGSTGIGLYNLKEKYRLLSVQKPKFYKEDGQYVAHLPLLYKPN
ncbi:histidine kinase [Porifericola rhodea]|uniref:sensor histidine kinase n=1 Tax=Porifericola rhodea TaxID=930972 RepID=UPI0026667C66|nr:histidine kinase [Porifericola rhodea]WKN29827.1 histidine kinase [Porifericola rhodea]